jgi:hypothetical protein
MHLSPKSDEGFNAEQETRVETQREVSQEHVLGLIPTRIKRMFSRQSPSLEAKGTTNGYLLGSLLRIHDATASLLAWSFTLTVYQ